MMDAPTFARLAARTKLTPASLRMARAVLVEGIGPAEAARREGVTRQRAFNAAARLLRELRNEGGYPPGWHPVTVVVPAAAEIEIEEIARRCRREAGLQVD